MQGGHCQLAAIHMSARMFRSGTHIQPRHIRWCHNPQLKPRLPTRKRQRLAAAQAEGPDLEAYRCALYTHTISVVCLSGLLLHRTIETNCQGDMPWWAGVNLTSTSAWSVTGLICDDAQSEHLHSLYCHPCCDARALLLAYISS